MEPAKDANCGIRQDGQDAGAVRRRARIARPIVAGETRHVNRARCKSWAQRLRIDGQPFNIGLGSYPVVTLAEAREKALANRRAVAQGDDPRIGVGDGIPAFADAVDKVLAIQSQNWKDTAKTERLWRSTLNDYAMPTLGRKSVAEITSGDVLSVIAPILGKRETAKKVRQRISAVMKWSIAQGYREDNPAGDALTAALPKSGARVEHRRALPFADVGAAIDHHPR